MASEATDRRREKPNAATPVRLRQRSSRRPVVWPYTLFMLFAGTLVSIVFIMGAFGNYKDENWLVAGLLTFAATAFIIVPPVITHRSLAPEAGRMVISEDDVDSAHGDRLSDTKPVVADAISGTILTLLEPPESSGSIVYEDAATCALSHLEDLFLTLLEAVQTNGQVKLDATSSAWHRPVLQAIVGFPWGKPTSPTTEDRRNTPQPWNCCFSCSATWTPTPWPPPRSTLPGTVAQPPSGTCRSTTSRYSASPISPRNTSSGCLIRNMRDKCGTKRSGTGSGRTWHSGPRDTRGEGLEGVSNGDLN